MNEMNEFENQNQSRMQTEEFQREVPKKKKKKSVFRLIFNVIITIISLVILVNAIIGVINFSQISNDKDPYVFTEVEKAETEDKITEVYHQGLFNIIVEKNMKNGLLVSEKWSLKPWFLK